jgi:hypothetical protein
MQRSPEPAVVGKLLRAVARNGGDRGEVVERRWPELTWEGEVIFTCADMIGVATTICTRNTGSTNKREGGKGDGWTRSWGGGRGREEKTDSGDTRRCVMLRTEALLRGTEEGEWHGAGAPAERRGAWRAREEVQGPRSDQRRGGGERWKRRWAKVWASCSFFIFKTHLNDSKGKSAEGTGPTCRRTYYSLEGSRGKSAEGTGPTCRRTFLPSHSPQIWTTRSAIGWPPFSRGCGRFFSKELLPL